MTENGWIKIHRSIWDNPWMYKPNVFTVWSYILCHVNYQPAEVIFEGKRITLQPGQGLFKLREMAELFKVSPATVHRIIKMLKNETQIETQTSPRNTVITVVNWQKYQANETQTETQVKHKRNTTETQVKHLPIIKEYKELKKDKNIYGTYQNVILSDEELEKLKSEFPLDYMDRIERLSEYMASTGKKYKNFLATIRNWARNDSKAQPIRKNDAASGYQRTLELLGIGDANGQS